MGLSDVLSKAELVSSDVDGTPFTYAIKIHIAYRFLKFTDLDWVYDVIRSTKKWILEEEEFGRHIDRKERNKLRFLVSSADTGNSIDIRLMLVSVTAAIGIVSYGRLLKQIYDSLKKQSERGVFIAKRGIIRSNLDEVRFGLTKRSIKRVYDEQGVLREEIVDEFEMVRDRRKWREFFFYRH